MQNTHELDEEKISGFLSEIEKTKKYLQNFEVLENIDIVSRMFEDEYPKVLSEIRMMKDLFPFICKTGDLYKEAYDIIKDMSRIDIFTSVDIQIYNAILTLGGTPKYDLEYINIYDKERNMRNLQGFQNLIKVNKQIRTNIKKQITPNQESSIKAYSDNAKNRSPDPEDFEKYFNSGDEDYVVLAGGSVLSMLLKTAYSDLDFFFHNCTVEKAKQIIKSFIENAIADGEEIKVFYNQHAVSVVSSSVNYQFITRIYSSPSQIIHGFDVDCSCSLYDIKSKEIYITERFYYAIKRRQNTFNFEKMSPSYEYRLLKNTLRRFGIYIPFYDEYSKKYPYGQLANEKGIAIFIKDIYRAKLNGKGRTTNEKSSFYDETSVELTNYDDLTFIVEDPNKQATGMFHQLVLEDREKWYIPSFPKIELDENKDRSVYIETPPLNPNMQYKKFKRDMINNLLVKTRTAKMQYFAIGSTVNRIFTGIKAPGYFIIGRLYNGEIPQNNENEDESEEWNDGFSAIAAKELGYIVGNEIEFYSRDKMGIFREYAAEDWKSAVPSVEFLPKKFGSVEEILEFMASGEILEYFDSNREFYDYENILMLGSRRNASEENPQKFGKFYYYKGYEENIINKFHNSTVVPISYNVLNYKMLTDDTMLRDE